MKLLLTSGGVTNDSIRAALEGLLGKPIDEADALFIPTAQWGHPMCSPASVYRSIVGRGEDWLTNLGWRSLGVLELTALPSIGRERWEPWVRDADVLLVDGGEAVYLADWIRGHPAVPTPVWSTCRSTRLGRACSASRGATRLRASTTPVRSCRRRHRREYRRRDLRVRPGCAKRARPRSRRG